MKNRSITLALGLFLAACENASQSQQNLLNPTPHAWNSNAEEIATWIRYHQELAEDISKAETVKTLKHLEVEAFKIRKIISRDIEEGDFSFAERSRYERALLGAGGESVIARVTAAARLKKYYFFKIIYLAEEIDTISSLIHSNCTQEEIIESQRAGTECFTEGISLLPDLAYLGTSQDVTILISSYDLLDKRAKFFLDPLGKRRLDIYLKELEKKLQKNLDRKIKT
jgi:hypothetical protein